MTTDEQARLALLAADIDRAGLGPISSIGMIGDSVIRVELDGTSPERSLLAQRWLTLITVFDMTAGQYRAADDTVYLNLRGRFPSGTAVVVAVPYSRSAEVDQVETIYRLIEQQDARHLIFRLVSLDAL